MTAIGLLIFLLGRGYSNAGAWLSTQEKIGEFFAGVGIAVFSIGIFLFIWKHFP